MRLLDRGYRHLYVREVESVHMKGPSVGFNERATRINYRHWAYIAAKLLQPADALLALWNLFVHIMFQAYSEDRRALRAVRDVPLGFARGLRSREPVRPNVSRVYRRHVRKFLSPLPLLRSPLERLRSGDDPERIEAARLARIERWYERRPEYYPRTTASLAL
jgi:GT2 family glycosyltransferase